MSRDLMEVTPTGLPPGQDPEQAAAMEDSETPTPEEQALYDKFVTRAIGFIHGEKTQGAVLEMMNQPSDPVHVNVGRAAVKVVQLIQQSAESSGQKLPDSVIYGAGQEIVEDLLETGVAAKLFPLDVESKEYDEALELSFLEAVKKYGEDLLAGPDGEQISAQAQDHYASEVAREADAGEVDQGLAASLQEQGANPEFAQMNPVADGVQKAVENG